MNSGFKSEMGATAGASPMAGTVSFEQLQARMAERYPGLSNRLQIAARYALEHPNEFALETVTELASRAGVQPSVLVRLSQALGFGGFSEMQKVFRGAIAERAPTYGERMRRLRQSPVAADGAPEESILRRFCDLNRVSLQHLAETFPLQALSRAVAIISAAAQVNVVGQRRSHTIASYLAYAFIRTGKRSRLLAGAGGSLQDELRMMTQQDVLIAVTMHPYSAETIAAVDWAADHDIPVIAITDGELSPISKRSDVLLEVRDPDFLGFRSLVAQMCLAQTLVIEVAAAQASISS